MGGRPSEVRPGGRQRQVGGWGVSGQVFSMTLHGVALQASIATCVTLQCCRCNALMGRDGAVLVRWISRMLSVGAGGAPTA